MVIREGFAENNGINIHYMDCNPDNTLATPLLICPGLSEPAEDYVKFASSLSPRRVVILSFRGRGNSDSPQNGYSLEHHISDVEAVVKTIVLQNFCLMGYSRGVSYALGFGLRHPNLLKGFILEEYPAEHKRMPKGWASQYLNFLRRTSGFERIRPHAITGIEQESNQVYFWKDLNKINCPVLLMRGGGEESLLSLEQVDMYLKQWEHVKVEVFQNAGHDIQTDDYGKFVDRIKDFLGDLDK